MRDFPQIMKSKELKLEIKKDRKQWKLKQSIFNILIVD